MTAPKWHAYLAPHPSDIAGYELIFDDADFPAGQTTISGIEVEIFELDASSSPKEATKDDALGTILVGLELANNQVEIRTAEFLPPARKRDLVAGMVDITAGPETFAVPVYMEPSERAPDRDPLWAIKRRDNVELGLSIRRGPTGFYSTFDVSYPNKAGVSPFVRRGLRGPVLTYIIYPTSLQDDTVRDFMLLYDNADGYWETRSDQLIRNDSPISLESIIKDLRDNRIRVGDGKTVWSEVNIVTHGTCQGIYMPLKDGKDMESLNRFHVEKLKGSFHQRPFEAVDSKFTQIHLRACTIGRDAGLLKQLSAAFGGCRVNAPDTHFIAYLRYQRNAGHPPEFKEFLYRQYWAYLPGAHATISRNAGAAALAAAPQKHTKTDGTAFEESDYRKMITAGRASRPHDGNASYFVIETPEVSLRLSWKPDDWHKSELDTFLASHSELEFALDRLNKDKVLKTELSKELREALRLDGHNPISLNAPEWDDLEKFAAVLNYEILLLRATNSKHSRIDDGPVDPSQPDDFRKIRIHVALVHAFIEICEKAIETTDLDFGSLAEVASSH